jgi:hypothetical protein
MFEKTSEGSVAGTKLELDCDGGSGVLVSKILQLTIVAATMNVNARVRIFDLGLVFRLPRDFNLKQPSALPAPD